MFRDWEKSFIIMETTLKGNTIYLKSMGMGSMSGRIPSIMVALKKIPLKV